MRGERGDDGMQEKREERGEMRQREDRCPSGRESGSETGEMI